MYRSGSGISITVQAQSSCPAKVTIQVGMDDASITKWQYTIAYQAPGDCGAWPHAAWSDVPNAYARTDRHTVTGLNISGTIDFTVRAINARATPPGVKSDVQGFTFCTFFYTPWQVMGCRKMYSYLAV